MGHIFWSFSIALCNGTRSWPKNIVPALIVERNCTLSGIVLFVSCFGIRNDGVGALIISPRRSLIIPCLRVSLQNACYTLLIPLAGWVNTAFTSMATSMDVRFAADGLGSATTGWAWLPTMITNHVPSIIYTYFLLSWQHLLEQHTEIDTPHRWYTYVYIIKKRSIF